MEADQADQAVVVLAEKLRPLHRLLLLEQQILEAAAAQLLGLPPKPVEVPV